MKIYYINVTDDESQASNRRNYGSNYDRLLALKNERSNQPLPPERQHRPDRVIREG